MRRALAGVLAGLVLTGLVLTGAPAAADPPFRVGGEVVDRAGVLGGGADRVREAVRDLRADRGTQLFVVYVTSFEGADGQRWAADTARLSQLGDGDVLFAVAVDDRAYGYSVPGDATISDDDLRDLMVRTVEPRLAGGDWAGAAVAVADGLGGRGDGTGQSLGLLLCVALVVVAAVVVVLVVVLRRRSRQAAGRAAGPAVAAGPPPVPVAELSRQAATALVDVDDAVQTSEQELAFAQAQFGDEAVTGFRSALDQARDELRQAFTLRQRLDDAEPEDEQTRRAILTEILRLCGSADARLDAQAEAFDRMRSLERTAPQVLAALAPRVEALAGRLPAEQARLDALRQRFAPTAVTPLADSLEQARHRLDAAREELAEARSAVDAGRPERAVVPIRAAEDATGQAGTLLDGITRTTADLEQADARIAAARSELGQDLEEARALVASDGSDLRPTIARAEAALTTADTAMTPAGTGLPDPLAALRVLEEAGADLDRALAAVREARQQRDRAAALVDRAILAATSAVAAADDFIATRRGAVGADARTRLAEARRQLDQAVAASASDPESALRYAQYADALAQQALQLARGDVDRWSQPAGLPGYGGGSGVDLGSLVLGGILLGGRSGSYGGSSGGFGGGWSPGSFGGSGTRARHGGGGRF
ncbi:TPM domain-containing protein [Virgisporangium ochraceum]|uniref:TPM domain-containing protein n=1 Tax=Virgisporangium ochraceum TaxID=65505 RepID=A0A8J3ZY72_9ACTN|nr:TPM domain-containing protein [Virgisporangium ochraceum]GIJ72272.1 hypothetical protein Voc01_071890 [Virgisporangium ochraceum]